MPMLGDSCAHAPMRMCLDGSHCSSAGTCVAGTVLVGGDCDDTNDLFCVAGAYCDGIFGPGACVAYPTDACY
jgi:hypothetical protein